MRLIFIRSLMDYDIFRILNYVSIFFTLKKVPANAAGAKKSAASSAPQIQKILVDPHLCSFDINALRIISSSSKHLQDELTTFKNAFSLSSAKTKTKLKEIKADFHLLSSIVKDFKAADNNTNSCCTIFRKARSKFIKSSAGILKKAVKDHPNYMTELNKTMEESETTLKAGFPDLTDLGTRIETELQSLVKQHSISTITKCLTQMHSAKNPKEKFKIIKEKLNPALEKFKQEHEETIKTIHQDAQKAKAAKCPSTKDFLKKLKNALKGEGSEPEEPKSDEATPDEGEKLEDGQAPPHERGAVSAAEAAGEDEPAESTNEQKPPQGDYNF